MNFGKLSPTAVSFLLTILTIGILIVPSIAITYAETLTVQNVLAVQGDYVNGTVIDTIQINQTLPIGLWVIQTELNETVGYDSAFYGHRKAGLTSTRWSILWDDMQTYLGNGTYEMNVNYSQMPDATYNNRIILVQLNINNSDWVNYDFIKVASDYEFDAMSIVYQTELNDGSQIQSLAITTDVDLYVNTLTTKADMNSYPTGKIWLLFEVPESSSEDEQFTFQVQGYNLSPADSLMWDDDQMYVLILLGSVIFMGIGCALLTDTLDLFWDTKKKPQNKKKNW